MLRSTRHVMTTHTGSLPRPPAIIEGMRAREDGTLADPAALDRAIAEEVKAIVRRQVEAGIHTVNDGECGRPSFFKYVEERLSGFERRVPQGGMPVPTAQLRVNGKDAQMFPDFYQSTLQNNPFANIIRIAPKVCVGPIKYIGHERLQQDIRNLKTAMAECGATEGFMSATTPISLAKNEYYPSAETFQLAYGEAVREEYKAIIEAGLILQLDDPGLAGEWDLHRDWDVDRHRSWAAQRVELLNHALRDLPQDRVRFHTCYGVNIGPRVSDLQLVNIIDLLYRINAGGYSFEGANPRHEHEWRVLKEYRLPEGKIVIPGVVTHSSPIVEHPELVADRIERWAGVVGRENLVVGNDCGFASNPGNSEIPPTVAWAKIRSLGEGARLATKRLWN